MLAPQFDPHYDCSYCTRLRDFILDQRRQHSDWHNGPVDTWTAKEGDEFVRLLIVGLAPGLQGANRTGRPFTGDYAGDLLYSTLLKFGFAGGEYDRRPDDRLFLKNSAITNAVRCVPPQNKPVGAEINNCRPFLQNTIKRFPQLSVILTLGKVSHDSTVRALGAKVSAIPFGHASMHNVGGYTLISSYHCSRYNTNTGRLTADMFEDVFELARRYCTEG